MATQREGEIIPRETKDVPLAADTVILQSALPLAGTDGGGGGRQTDLFGYTLD